MQRFNPDIYKLTKNRITLNEIGRDNVLFIMLHNEHYYTKDYSSLSLITKDARVFEADTTLHKIDNLDLLCDTLFTEKGIVKLPDLPNTEPDEVLPKVKFLDNLDKIAVYMMIDNKPRMISCTFDTYACYETEWHKIAFRVIRELVAVESEMQNYGKI